MDYEACRRIETHRLSGTDADDNIPAGVETTTSDTVVRSR